MNIPLRKCDTSPEMASALLEQELFEDEAEEQLPCNEPLKNETDVRVELDSHVVQKLIES